MAARSARKTQTHLPKLEADGVTHARGCECPRCETGFVPSEAERAASARWWAQHQETERLRRAAEEALARKRERARVKALRLELELAEDERRTEDLLRAQAAVAERVAQDEKLDALLASRRSGRPVEEAIAEVEQKFSGGRSRARRSGG